MLNLCLFAYCEGTTLIARQENLFQIQSVVGERNRHLSGNTFVLTWAIGSGYICCMLYNMVRNHSEVDRMLKHGRFKQLS